jgi:hypothetical protein
MAKNNAWSRDDIALLSKLTPDDFYDLFKGQRGDDFGRVVRTSLQFSNMGGTGDQERAISAKAREAMARIGRESPINRRRVRKFGVQVDDDPPAVPRRRSRAERPCPS